MFSQFSWYHTGQVNAGKLAENSIGMYAYGRMELVVDGVRRRPRHSIRNRCTFEQKRGASGVTATVYSLDASLDAAAPAQRSIQAMRRTLVEPGVPKGTPAVMTTRSPDPAISSR